MINKTCDNARIIETFTQSNKNHCFKNRMNQGDLFCKKVFSQVATEQFVSSICVQNNFEAFLKQFNFSKCSLIAKTLSHLQLFSEISELIWNTYLPILIIEDEFSVIQCVDYRKLSIREKLAQTEKTIRLNLKKSHVTRLKSNKYNSHVIRQYVLKSQSYIQINLMIYHFMKR